MKLSLPFARMVILQVVLPLMPDWMAISYAGPRSQKWALIGSGSGGVSEIRELVKEDNVFFALFRLEDQIDDSTTVKFVMLNWLGEKLPRMAKARLSVHRGTIESLLNVFHHLTSNRTIPITRLRTMTK